MKQIKLKKRVIIEGAVCGGVVVFLLVLALLLDSKFDDVTTELATKNNSVNQLNNELQKAEADYKKASDSIVLYKSIKEKSLSDSGISREKASKVIEGLKDKYKLTYLEIKIPPPQEVKFSEVSANKVKIMQSPMDMKFGAMSDSHVFAFLDHVRKDLGGVVRFKNLSMARKLEMDNQTLAMVAGGMFPEVVSASVQLQWYGFTNAEAAKDGKDAKK